MKKANKLVLGLSLTAALALTGVGGTALVASAETTGESEYVAQGTTYENDGMYYRDTKDQRIGAVYSKIEGMSIQSLLTATKQGPATEEGGASSSASTDIFGMQLNTDTTGIELAGKALVFQYEKLVNAQLYFAPILETADGKSFTLETTYHSYVTTGGGISEGGHPASAISYKIGGAAAGWLEGNGDTSICCVTFILPLSEFSCKGDTSATLSDIANVKFVYSFGAGSTYQLKANVGTLKLGTLTGNEGTYTLSEELTTIFAPVKADGTKAVEGTDWDYYMSTSVEEANPKRYCDVIPLCANELFFSQVGAHESTAMDVKFPASLTNSEGFIDIGSIEGILVNVKNLSDTQLGFRLAIWDGDGTKWSALRTGASLCIPEGASPENGSEDVYWRRTGNIPANYEGQIVIPLSVSDDNPVFSGGTKKFPDLCSKTYNAFRMYMTNAENLGADLIIDFQFITCLKDYASTVQATAENGTVATDKISYEGLIAVKTGEEISLTLTPDEGYEMASLEINGLVLAITSDEVSFTLTVTENIKIGIVCDLKNYNITYHLNGGENDAENPDSYTIKTVTIDFVDPVKEGDSFLGWYDNAEFKGDAITSVKRGSTGDMELYAKWSSSVDNSQQGNNNGDNNGGCNSVISAGAISVGAGLGLLLPAACLLKRKKK